MSSALVKLTTDGQLLVATNTVATPDYTLNVADYTAPGHVQDGWHLVKNAQQLFAQLGHSLPKAIGGPIVVTPLQARVALANAGLLADVEEFVMSLPVMDQTRIAWEYALEFREDSQMLNTVCQELGITEAQKKELLVAASQVSV